MVRKATTARPPGPDPESARPWTDATQVRLYPRERKLLAEAAERNRLSQVETLRALVRRHAKSLGGVTREEILP